MSQGSDAQPGRSASISKKLPGETQPSLWESKRSCYSGKPDRMASSIETKGRTSNIPQRTNPPGVKGAPLPTQLGLFTF